VAAVEAGTGLVAAVLEDIYLHQQALPKQPHTQLQLALVARQPQLLLSRAVTEQILQLFLKPQLVVAVAGQINRIPAHLVVQAVAAQLMALEVLALQVKVMLGRVVIATIP